jgi:hypothetical protein
VGRLGYWARATRFQVVKHRFHQNFIVTGTKKLPQPQLFEPHTHPLISEINCLKAT